jgi:hypothetical protein
MTAAQSAPPAQTSPLAVANDIPKAQAAIKRTLKDGESARFSGDVLKPDAVCGLVNSKNSYGGYVGQTPYLYLTGTGETFILQTGRYQNENMALLEKFESYCRT